ncbi:hypothetical protein ACJX0J_008053, partial [Zea mays]
FAFRVTFLDSRKTNEMVHNITSSSYSDSMNEVVHLLIHFFIWFLHLYNI